MTGTLASNIIVFSKKDFCVPTRIGMTCHNGWRQIWGSNGQEGQLLTSNSETARLNPDNLLLVRGS